MEEKRQPSLFLNGKLLNGYLHIPADSLLALCTLQCSKLTNVDITFVCDKVSSSLGTKGINLEVQCFKIPFDKFDSDFKFISSSESPLMVQNSLLPAVYESNYCIVGFCSSLRHILCLNSTDDPNDICQRLLGFRGGCLQACAEVSVWTKFCEIEVLEMVNDAYFKVSDKPNIPVNIVRLEKHLEHPPILHNALKRKQEILLKTTSSRDEYIEMKKKKLHDLPQLEHQYAEGLDLSLADVLLFVCFDLVFHIYSGINFKSICPLVLKWYKFLKVDESINCCSKLLQAIKQSHVPTTFYDDSIKIPSVADESLYKSDPMRYKPRWRSYTNQNDIENILNKLNSIEILSDSFICNTLTESNSISNQDLLNDINKLSINVSNNNRFTISDLRFESNIDWEALPPAAHPIEGQLPASRLQRKCEQLESIVQVVLSIAKDGNVIVDFCAGGGHLGIILAYLLPKCLILLVENKKFSLDKALTRVKALQLTNVQFYQCNLDYFEAKFDIGTCLHACGVATDLVLKKCIDQNASFVASPCCYGSLRPNHVLCYPRSSMFTDELKIDLAEYLILGHSADQTHDENNPKTLQGKRCMQLIDYDRLTYASSQSYKTRLIVMNPHTCTPKNHILLGVASKILYKST